MRISVLIPNSIQWKTSCKNFALLNMGGKVSNSCQRKLIVHIIIIVIIIIIIIIIIILLLYNCIRVH